MSAPVDTANPFLSVPELAALLHVNEKKVYQLAGSGILPGTKVTGKWIFPRKLIEDWLLESSHGGVMQDRLLLAGSDDRLMHHVCSQAAIDWQRDALISYSPNGTRHGLRMLDQGRVDGCFINWGAAEPSARRHLGLLRGYANHAQWVIVRCLQRSQGFVMRNEVAEKFTTQTLAEPSTIIQEQSLSWAMRQDDSGTERLLEDLCSAHHLSTESFTTSDVFNSERAAVAAVNTGVADICCGVQSTAHEFGLHYVPIATVSLDLVLPQKTFFRTLVQELVSRIQALHLDETPTQLDGYNINRTLQVMTLKS